MTTPDVVSEARRLFAESAVVRANLAAVEATRPLVGCAELVPALCDELERLREGLRTGAAERDRLRQALDRCERTIDEVSRLAADDTVSDAYLRGFIVGGDR